MSKNFEIHDTYDYLAEVEIKLLEILLSLEFADTWGGKTFENKWRNPAVSKVARKICLARLEIKEALKELINLGIDANNPVHKS